LPDDPTRPQLAMTEAWISVLVNTAKAENRYHVSIKKRDTKDGPLLAGTVEVRKWWNRFKAALRSNPKRFPNYGGWTVVAGQEYEIKVTKPGEPDFRDKAVFKGSFAPRAIIDFNLSV
jgi:hypothetical protein